MTVIPLSPLPIIPVTRKKSVNRIEILFSTSSIGYSLAPSRVVFRNVYIPVRSSIFFRGNFYLLFSPHYILLTISFCYFFSPLSQSVHLSSCLFHGKNFPPFFDSPSLSRTLVKESNRSFSLLLLVKRFRKQACSTLQASQREHTPFLSRIALSSSFIRRERMIPSLSQPA